MSQWNVEDCETKKSVLLTPKSSVSGGAFVARRKDRIQVWLKGRTFEFKVTSPEEFLRSKLKSSEGESPNELHSKMPGKVLTVKVKPGDSVEANQTILVLEAMKMENHLSIPRQAIVEKVHIETNQIVESGALLITFKATPA